MSMDHPDCLVLGTPSGNLTLEQLEPAGGVCDQCGHQREELAVVELAPVLSGFTICGPCLAEGLAILLGRRHVQAGGALEDLGPGRPTG